MDVMTYSRFGVPVRALDIAKRQHLSLSRVENLLATLKSASLIQSAKGRKVATIFPKILKICLF